MPKKALTYDIKYALYGLIKEHLHKIPDTDLWEYTNDYSDNRCMEEVGLETNKTNGQAVAYFRKSRFGKLLSRTAPAATNRMATLENDLQALRLICEHQAKRIHSLRKRVEIIESLPYVRKS